MIARYIVARDDAEDPRRVTERLLVAGVEEGGIAGVGAHGNCPYFSFRVGRDATLFNREIGHFVVAIRFQSLSSKR